MPHPQIDPYGIASGYSAPKNRDIDKIAYLISNDLLTDYDADKKKLSAKADGQSEKERKKRLKELKELLKRIRNGEVSREQFPFENGRFQDATINK